MPSTALLTTDAYRQRADDMSTIPFWDLPDLHDPRGPERPYVWRGDDVIDQLLRSADIDGDVAGESQRRALLLRNPGLTPPAFGATQTLVAAYQALLPGESAPVHSHSFSALRFGISGTEARMTVDGQRVPLLPGDLVLTPSWCWHGHAHVGGDEPVVWFDGLDVPFVASLRAGFFRELPGQGWTPHDTEGTALVGFETAGVVRYPWDQAEATLDRLLAVAGEDGVTLDYRNPATGGPTLPTIGCRLDGLAPHGRRAAPRETASSVLLVVRGSGRVTVDGTEMSVQRNDVAVVPAWRRHELDAGADGLVLFRITDRPVLESFGLYRSE